MTDWDYYYYLIDEEGENESVAYRLATSNRTQEQTTQDYVTNCYDMGIDVFYNDIDDPFPNEW